MVFSSITFLFAFLAVVLLIYFCCPLKGKNWVLAISGLVFYAWGEPVYVVLMLFTTLLDYTAGRVIDRYGDRLAIRRAAMIGSIVINVSLLGVFKYSSFFIQNINGLFGLSLADPKLPLPIGISFYTFQSMSYTIDMYRGIPRSRKITFTIWHMSACFPSWWLAPSSGMRTWQKSWKTVLLPFKRWEKELSSLRWAWGKRCF